MENATMNEGPPASPPPQSARVLQRPAEGRLLAGAARALADYSLINVTIVRILFVALTLFGGSGLILYIACALLIPSQNTTGGPNYTTLDRLKTDRAPATIFGLVVLALGALILLGAIGDSDFVLPFALIVGGAGLLLWNNNSPAAAPGAVQPDPAGVATNNPVAPPPPPAGSTHTPAPETFEPAPAVVYQAPAAAAYQEPPANWIPPQPPQYTPPPRQPKTRSKLTWLTLAGLATYFGLAIVLDQTTSLNADFDRTMAWGLAALGGVLAVSAFLGKARGLIFFGLVMLPLMFLGGADWDPDGFDVETRVVELDLLGNDYSTSIGSVEYDFSQLDLDGQTKTIDIEHNIGEVLVRVPNDVELVIDARAGVGDVTVLGRNDDGPSADVSYSGGQQDNNNGTLILDINVGVGEIEVTQ